MTLSEREPVLVPRSQVTVKTVATVCGVVVGVGLAAYLAMHSLIAITLTVCAALLAIALNHGVDHLVRWGLSRPLSIAIVATSFVGAIVAIGAVLIPSTAQQLQQAAERAPEMWARFHETHTFRFLDGQFHLDRRVDSWREQQQTPEGTEGLEPVMMAGRGALAAATATVTILFLSFFMLVYGKAVVQRFLAESLPAHRERYERVLSKVYRSVGGYLSGLVSIAALNTLLTSIFLAVMGVPFFLPLGILSGVGSFVPLIGVTLSGVVMTLITLVTKGPVAAVAVVAWIIVYQQFENHVVTPLVYRRTVKLNPLVTLVAVIFLTELAGVVGAFLAVPFAAAGQIILRELLVLRRERLGIPLKGEVASALRRRWFRSRPERHA